MHIGLGMGLTSLAVLQRVGGAAFDPDAATYLAAVEAADGEALEEGVKTAINDFVVGCKADGIWSAIEASCILAGARTLPGALVPLSGAAPTSFNFVSGDYDRKAGLKGDGATKYVNTNRNSNQQPQESRHHAVYVSDVGTTTTNRTHLGTGYVNNDLDFNDISSLDDGRFISRIGLGTSNTINSPSGNTVGLMGASRSSTSSMTQRVADADYPESRSSASPRDTVFYAFNRNGASLFSDARISFYSIGENINLSSLEARIDTLMTAIDGAIA